MKGPSRRHRRPQGGQADSHVVADASGGTLPRGSCAKEDCEKECSAIHSRLQKLQTDGMDIKVMISRKVVELSPIFGNIIVSAVKEYYFPSLLIHLFELLCLV